MKPRSVLILLTLAATLLAAAPVAACSPGSRFPGPHSPGLGPAGRVPAGGAAAAARPQPHRHRHRCAEGRREGLEEAQRKLRADLEAAKGDRGRLNQMLLDTAARTRAVEQQLIDVEGRIAQLDRSAADLNTSLGKRRGVLAQVLAALMRMGREPPPAILMRPDDALDAVRSAILLGALLPELRVEAETLASDLSELSRVRTELASARDSLTSLRADLDEDSRRLAVLVGERRRRQAEEHPVASADKAQAEKRRQGHRGRARSRDEAGERGWPFR